MYNDDNIDFDFYKNYYNDLNNLSIIDLLFHYNNYGICENRYPNFNIYLKSNSHIFNDFNLELYKKQYNLYHLTDHNLYFHY